MSRKDYLAPIVRKKLCGVSQTLLLINPYLQVSEAAEHFQIGGAAEERQKFCRCWQILLYYKFDISSIRISDKNFNTKSFQIKILNQRKTNIPVI